MPANKPPTENKKLLLCTSEMKHPKLDMKMEIDSNMKKRRKTRTRASGNSKIEKRDGKIGGRKNKISNLKEFKAFY